MTDEPGEAIRRRDEILQLMYWMYGEGLGEEPTADDLLRFLDDDARDTVVADLEALAASGLVTAGGGARYRLTPHGRREGGRRFVEEFQELMRPGHGVCDNPLCDCHTRGPEACVSAG